MGGVALAIWAVAAALQAEGGDGTVILDERPAGAATAPAVVVPREALVAPGATVRDVLNRQPGVGATSLGGLGALTQVSIRGTSADQVRVFVDGVPLELADGSPVDLSELPLWGAARLDIWRTHAPLARGGGLGGAIELRTLAPAGGLAEVSAGYGAFGTGQLRAFVGHGAPRGPGVALAVELQTSDGDFGWWSDEGTLFDPSDDTRRVRHNNALRRLTTLASVRAPLGGRCLGGLLEAFALGARGLPGPASTPALRASVGRLTSLTAARLDCRRAGAWSLEAVAALRLGRTTSFDPDAELYLTPSEARRDAVSPSVSVTAGWRLSPVARLGAHVEGSHDHFALSDPLAPASAATLDRTRGAVAVEAGLSWPALALELVPRLRVDAFGDAGGEAAVEPTWQAALAWRGLEAVGVRAQAAVGRAVRLPNLYELYGDGALVLPSPALRAERGLTATATLGWAPGFLPTGWLADVELSAFTSEVADLIQFRRNTLQTAVAENVANARLAGFEVAARADLLGHLRLGLVHSTLATETLSAEAARDGQPLPLRPTARNALHLEGYLAADDGGELRAFADLDHVGSNTFDPAGLVRAPARATASAGLGWRLALSGIISDLAELDVGLAVRNLTDAPLVDVVGYPLPGRGWTLQLSWREQGL